MRPLIGYAARILGIFLFILQSIFYYYLIGFLFETDLYVEVNILPQKILTQLIKRI